MFVRECVSKRGSRGVRRERIAALLSERADVAIWQKNAKKGAAAGLRDFLWLIPVSAIIELPQSDRELT